MDNVQLVIHIKLSIADRPLSMVNRLLTKIAHCQLPIVYYFYQKSRGSLLNGFINSHI